ncbi:membrane protein [Ensifer adhaerens]|uniref:Membrane protein n=1 Tax=Ensifer adhaerens TaxID=106592 RepID=A0A0L8BRM0_ENSAD|nr:YqaA family protein [Ensifer adhaerens]KOF17185.1 membrane protein [Ensifer adhaerens]
MLVFFAVIDLTAYIGLFLVAFGAATVLPFQSEPVLVGLLLSGKFSVAGLIAVARLGDVLGAVTNWVVGRFIDRFHDAKWFPVKAASLERASGWYRRYGRWSLLLSWMPLFGDALTVTAGVLREPLWSFVVLVTLAKTGRYLALTAATLGTQAVLGL